MFNKISTWNKWDLHVHTRASRIKKGNGEYFGNGSSFTNEEIIEFVDCIFYEEGPSLIAITDHDFFDVEQFKKIKNEVFNKSNILRKDLNVLPGVEYDVKFKLSKNGKIFDSFDDEAESKDSKRIHCVIVFNDDVVSNRDMVYSKIIQATNKHYPSDDTPVYIDELIQTLVESKLEFIIIPHFDKDRGIESGLPDRNPNMKEQKTNWILCDYFPLLDGKQSNFIDGKIKHIYEVISKCTNGHSVPIILTSDNHNYKDYKKCFDDGERELSYYKSLPTFKGLKMCISDFSQRVSQTYKDISNPFISKILICDKKSDENSEIELSNSLNCVIGGRSSGKSFLLRKIYDRATDDKDNKKALSYYKNLSDISIILYDENGKEYLGKPDFYSQGSIIEKYNNDKNGLSLQQEFKEYFPKTFDEDKIRNEKHYIKNLLLEYNDCLINIARIKEDIIKRNAIDYFKINSDIHMNFISSNKMEERILNITKALTDLKTFKSNLINNLYLLSSFPDLKKQVDDFILNIDKKIEFVSKWKIIYDKILECSKSCISKINENMSDAYKKQKNQIMALRNFTSRVAEYCNNNKKAIEIISRLREYLGGLKKAETVYKNMGHFKFAVKLTNNLSITVLFNCFKDYLKNIGNPSNFDLLLKKINDVGYESYSTKNLEQLLNQTLESSYSIEYLIYEKNELINEMSEGRKVGVFINLLLTKEDTIEPLIIDQPEDDMDNADIYKILVNTLRKTKNKRQIIFATHDSNIVVNGDSENVIYAKKIKKNILSYSNGSLEYEDSNLNIQKIICETLEGGEKAFVTRANKYDINKLKLYEWRDDYESDNE